MLSLMGVVVRARVAVGESLEEGYDSSGFSSGFRQAEAYPRSHVENVGELFHASRGHSLNRSGWGSVRKDPGW